MDYRIEPTRLGRRSSAAVLIGATAVVVGLGVVLAVLALQRPPFTSTTVADATVLPAPSSTPRPSITCHDVERVRCTHVAEAALGAIEDPTLPTVRGVEVWATLLCGDTLDCPPDRLGERRVAGSAVVGLVDERALWVNVTEIRRGMFDAWVVRMQPRG